MTLPQIEYVLAVAKEQSFRGAAQARCVSQPTLSMQIQKFEEELGVSIVDRSKSPILATKIVLLVKQCAFPNHTAATGDLSHFKKGVFKGRTGFSLEICHS